MFYKGKTKIQKNNFTVELPQTLREIKANAFDNCVNVGIAVNLRDMSKLNEWGNALTISSVGNEHVLDVILNKRPKIGWGEYVGAAKQTPNA